MRICTITNMHNNCDYYNNCSYFNNYDYYDDCKLDKELKVNIGNIIPISTVDWPGRPATVIFFNGCNFKCHYCQNYKLINGKNFVDIDYVIKKIFDSEMFINAVVFSGGECTLQYEALERLAKFVKSRKLLVGIQTNGYFPDRLKKLIEKNLIDKIFLDVKASPQDKKLYEDITKVNDSSDKVIETLNIPLNHNICVEVRTTIFRSINHSDKIAKYLVDNNLNYVYVIQQGRTENTLDPDIKKDKNLTRDEMLEIANNIKHIRGVKIKTKEKGEEDIY